MNSSVAVSPECQPFVPVPVPSEVDNQSLEGMERLVKAVYPKAQYVYDSKKRRHYVYGVYDRSSGRTEPVYVDGQDIARSRLAAWKMAAELISLETLWDRGFLVFVSSPGSKNHAPEKLPD